MAVKASASVTLSRVNDGKGISTSNITYQAGTSGTTAPTGTWSATVPNVGANQYLWTRVVVNYTEGSPTTYYTVGKMGATGATGTGVASITPEFYLSTSKTTQAGGSWVTTSLTWSTGKYMWTRDKIVYKDPTSTVYTTPKCDSSWEAINEIEVGGKNLILDSGKEHSVTTSYNVCNYSLSEPLVLGETYVFTIWADLSSDRQWIGLWGDGGSWNPFGQINRNSGGVYRSKPVTLTSLPSNKTSNFNIYSGPSNSIASTSSVTVKKIKLEKGNKATDWTPAPEDMATGDDIDNVKESITETTKTLNETIAKANGEVQKISKTVETNSTNIQGIKSDVLSLERSTEGLNAELIKKLVTNDKLTGLVSETTLKAYLDWGIDDDGHSVLNLGGSKFKTNTRLRDDGLYVDVDGNTSAYFTSNGMYSNEVETKECKIGDFTLRVDSSGNFIIS